MFATQYFLHRLCWRTITHSRRWSLSTQKQLLAKVTEGNIYNKLRKTLEKIVIPCPGGVLPYKRLMGMCHWMGSHFHEWIDYNGVEFSIELLEWGRTFSDFWGKKILLSRDSKWSRLKNSESCCLLNVTITSLYIPFLKPQLQY